LRYPVLISSVGRSGATRNEDAPVSEQAAKAWGLKQLIREIRRPVLFVGRSPATGVYYVGWSPCGVAKLLYSLLRDSRYTKRDIQRKITVSVIDWSSVSYPGTICMRGAEDRKVND